MNMIDEKIEKGLLEWANWCNRKANDGIGWYSNSILNKIGEGRGVLLTSVVPETNEIAEAVERFIVRLAKIKNELAHALRIYYCETGTVRKKAEEIGISPTAFLRNVEMAKERLSGYIEEAVRHDARLRLIFHI